MHFIYTQECKLSGTLKYFQLEPKLYSNQSVKHLVRLNNLKE